MLEKYLKERLSWIMLFVLLQMLTLFIASMDPSISIKSALYIVFLSAIIFILFLLFRYNKETRFYRSVDEWDNSFDLAEIKGAASPFEEIIAESLNRQTVRYKKELSQNLIKVDQDQDELLSWIHEVKTPLTTMQLMMERIPDPTLKSQLMFEWLRVHLLLDQQLHQKRMPFIQNDLHIEVTSLEPLINQEIKGLQSWCIQKGIGFDISLQEKDVLSDAKWLSFMIRQLLTNAVKYSESSNIIIQSERKEERTTLIIQDFGRGIDPKDLPRIFEKGFTSTTHHQNHAATGMGLYLTEKAAKSLLIQIGVESTVGAGTTFTLTFPEKNEFVKVSSM